METPDADQNAVKRLLELPLVSSTCYLVSLVYCNLKESHPRVKPFCEVAETGMKTIASVAVTSAAPIVFKFQPQIAGANQLMCKYLDKTEEAFPILQQHLAQVVSRPDSVLTTAKNARAVMVHIAKDAVMVVKDKAGVVLREAMVMTQSALDGGFGTVLGSRAAQLLNGVMKTSPTVHETAAAQRPTTAEDSGRVSDSASKKPGHYVCLPSISTKVCHRADCSTDGEQDVKMELRAVVTSSGLTNQLQTLCLTFVSSLHGFQQNVQIQVLAVAVSASEVCNSLWKAYIRGEFSDQTAQPQRAIGQGASVLGFHLYDGQTRRLK
ncbi:perilipin-2-like [Brienomyrus brachyistius]|uniref:perilipin-2-like n=1 Tax=Brienomyrus brachyistius TaxID=42636 RepID=UPI0020B38A1D|nr:perilipin-2-like [Brienomyrus brachyistius]XP_048852099.1 perilipin-2-like [Brienomyrus brachyistius]XP_048852100.1 perilipin-2-like [Brienomyrus brachyistius]